MRRRLRQVRLIEGRAERVDWATRRVDCVSAVGEERFSLAFDLLAIAVGAAVGDYGVPGVREHALTLASVEDARAVRRGILDQFARAEVPGLSDEEVARRLTFVVCGGGATGVELAAEVHDLLAGELAASYPELAPRGRVVLVEATERILGGFDAALGGYAHRHFQREGIEVRLATAVSAVERDGVRLRDGGFLPAGLVLWAGGNAPVPFIATLQEPLTPRGRLRVDDHLRLPGRTGVYALGDCAAVGAKAFAPGSDAEPGLPATAQVAQQQGEYLAKMLDRGRRGLPVGPFRFRSAGMLAYIGGGQALADLPYVKWSGRAAWLFWRSVYLTKLVSPANKVKVLFDWVKAMLFGRDLSRF